MFLNTCSSVGGAIWRGGCLTFRRRNLAGGSYLWGRSVRVTNSLFSVCVKCGQPASCSRWHTNNTPSLPLWKAK